jgi:GNAT superfamily N-acetyltransferase
MKEESQMVETITIRKGNLADIATILHHRRAMFFDMGHTDAAALDRMEASGEPWLHQAIAGGWYKQWLAEDGHGKIVAGAGVVVVPWPSHYFTADTRRAVVLNVYTEPEYRRRGIGRKVMQEVISWARKERFDRLYLHASDAGRPLYESLGFVANNEMKLEL